MSKQTNSLVAVVIVLLIAAAQYFDILSLPGESSRQSTQDLPSIDVLLQAFESKQSNVQVYGNGRVKRLLPDDNKGSRHQRFILTLDSGQTILIAHNIDLANKITSLRVNDQIEFYGVYEWNQQGGVVHWTHHDPDGSHINGWLKHDGLTYQ